MVKALSLIAAAAAVLAFAMPADAQRQVFRSGARIRIPVAPPGSYAAFDRRGDRRGAFGRGRGFGRGGFNLGLWGWGLIDDPERHRDDGFFAGTGNSARVNGTAVYDYDRAYPYDWYRSDDVVEDYGEGPRQAAWPMRCELTRVSGSAVRICRGRR